MSSLGNRWDVIVRRVEQLGGEVNFFPSFNDWKQLLKGIADEKDEMAMNFAGGSFEIQKNLAWIIFQANTEIIPKIPDGMVTAITGGLGVSAVQAVAHAAAFVVIAALKAQYNDKPIPWDKYESIISKTIDAYETAAGTKLMLSEQKNVAARIFENIERSPPVVRVFPSSWQQPGVWNSGGGHTDENQNVGWQGGGSGLPYAVISQPPSNSSVSYVPGSSQSQGYLIPMPQPPSVYGGGSYPSPVPSVQYTPQPYAQQQPVYSQPQPQWSAPPPPPQTPGYAQPPQQQWSAPPPPQTPGSFSRTITTTTVTRSGGSVNNTRITPSDISRPSPAASAQLPATNQQAQRAAQQAAVVAAASAGREQARAEAAAKEVARQRELAKLVRASVPSPAAQTPRPPSAGQTSKPPSPAAQTPHAVPSIVSAARQVVARQQPPPPPLTPSRPATPATPRPAMPATPRPATPATPRPAMPARVTTTTPTPAAKPPSSAMTPRLATVVGKAVSAAKKYP